MQNNAFYCLKWLPAYCMQGYVGHDPTIAVLRYIRRLLAVYVSLPANTQAY